MPWGVQELASEWAACIEATDDAKEMRSQPASVAPAFYCAAQSGDQLDGSRISSPILLAIRAASFAKSRPHSRAAV